MLQENKTIFVGTLAPHIAGAPPPPSERPIARALQALEEEGIWVIFGNELAQIGNKTIMKGLRADNRTNQWVNCTHEIIALHDRYPSQRRWKKYEDARRKASLIPMGNAFEITMLCRDKLATQKLLSNSVRMPHVVHSPEVFVDRINEWGSAFIKPQFGAFGANVKRISKGDPFPLRTQLEGVVPGRMEPAILQRAVQPPNGWAGLCVRQLCQRAETGSWLKRTAVLRRSADDPVVNVSRGAEALPAIDYLESDTIGEIKRLSDLCCAIISKTKNGLYAVELGIDFVIDQEMRPWVIEVNSRPRGRIEALAQQAPSRFMEEHLDACIQPIRYIAKKAIQEHIKPKHCS